MPIHQLTIVLLLFGFLSFPTRSWAQSTAAGGVLAGGLVDGAMVAKVTLSAPYGFGTVHRVRSLGSTIRGGLMVELGEARPLAGEAIERKGEPSWYSQMQPTKLKKISRTKLIIIVAVAVAVVLVVTFVVGFDRWPDVPY